MGMKMARVVRSAMMLPASLVALMFGLVPIASAQFKLPTADEAMAISQNSGRPIFALAGRET